MYSLGVISSNSVKRFKQQAWYFSFQQSIGVPGGKWFFAIAERPECGKHPQSQLL